MKRNIGRWRKLLSFILVFVTVAVLSAMPSLAETGAGKGGAVAGEEKDDRSSENGVQVENQEEEYSAADRLMEEILEKEAQVEEKILSDAEKETGDLVIHIRNINDLDSLRDNLNADAVLDNDLDMGGMIWKSINGYTGDFEGNRHTISNCRIPDSDGGLFNRFYGNIRNLTVSNITSGTTEEYTEGSGGYTRKTALIGLLGGQSIVDNCHVTDCTIYGSAMTAGMIGTIGNKGTSLHNCSVRNTTITVVDTVGKAESPYTDESGIKVLNAFETGGLAALIYDNTSIDNCSVDHVTISNTISCNIGGMFGTIRPSLQKDTYETKNCQVTDTVVKGYAGCGGFVGEMNRGKIIDCRTNATINCLKGTAGGFAGSVHESKHPVMSDFLQGAEKLKLGEKQTYVFSDRKTEFDNCCATGNVTGSDTTGGFVGEMYGGTFINCFATGDVASTGAYSGNWNMNIAGGFAGLSRGDVTNSIGYMEHCHATGNVTARKGAGGFIGVLSPDGWEDFRYQCLTGTDMGIRECFATGDVEATDQHGFSAAGGFVGYTQGLVAPVDCYAGGDVKGYQGVGGFAGTLISAACANCYSYGKVKALVDGSAGGFAGVISRPLERTVCLTNCVYDRDQAGTDQAIGFRYSNIDKVYNGTLDEGKRYWPDVNTGYYDVHAFSTEEMKKADSYITLKDVMGYARYTGNGKGKENMYYEDVFSWDFSDVWNIDSSGSYPYLKQCGEGQVPELLTSKKYLAVGEKASVYLNGIAQQENTDIQWIVQGTANKTNSANHYVEFEANEDGQAAIELMVNGIVLKRIKIQTGITDGKHLSAVFLSPASVVGGIEGYCIETDASIKIRFSEPLSDSSIENITNTVKLKKNGYASVKYTPSFSNSNTVVTLLPVEKLDYGTSYVIELNGNIDSETGLTLGDNISMLFHTCSFEKPFVSSVISGNEMKITAEYADQIPCFDDDGEPMITTDHAKVYFVVRSGAGARENFGGDTLSTATETLSVKTGETGSVSTVLPIDVSEGQTVYIDVYTWDEEFGCAVAKSVTIKKTI